MSALLELDRVSAGYQGRAVVEGVSFRVRAGELCVLLGLNGSGKSTLLKTVCGLLPALGGRMRAGGRDLAGMRERQRARLLSYIPQRPDPDPSLRVLDVVCMGYNPWLGLLESPSPAQRDRAAQTLEEAGLPGACKDRLYGQLSEGQRQLVIFARALVQDAPVLLMDEPDSALDFVNRRQVLSRIAQTVRAQNRAGLITLHDPNSALEYGDRLLLLRNGALIADLPVRTTPPGQLEAALSQLYGPVKLLPHEGRLFLL